MKKRYWITLIVLNIVAFIPYTLPLVKFEYGKKYFFDTTMSNHIDWEPIGYKLINNENHYTVNQRLEADTIIFEIDSLILINKVKEQLFLSLDSLSKTLKNERIAKRQFSQYFWTPFVNQIYRYNYPNNYTFDDLTQAISDSCFLNKIVLYEKSFVQIPLKGYDQLSLKPKVIFSLKNVLVGDVRKYSRTNVYSNTEKIEGRIITNTITRTYQVERYDYKGTGKIIFDLNLKSNNRYYHKQIIIKDVPMIITTDADFIIFIDI